MLPSRDVNTKKILILDDDDGIRNLLEVLVGSAGFQFCSATSGEEAISLLSQKPDLLLIDLIMPGCGGLGVIKHLGTLPPPVPPVVVLTAYQNKHPDVLEAMKDPNVHQCLAKPIRAPVLVEALCRCLGLQPPLEDGAPA